MVIPGTNGLSAQPRVHIYTAIPFLTGIQYQVRNAASVQDQTSASIDIKNDFEDSRITSPNLTGLSIGLRVGPAFSYASFVGEFSVFTHIGLPKRSKASGRIALVSDSNPDLTANNLFLGGSRSWDLYDGISSVYLVGGLSILTLKHSILYKATEPTASSVLQIFTDRLIGIDLRFGYSAYVGGRTKMGFEIGYLVYPRSLAISNKLTESTVFYTGSSLNHGLSFNILLGWDVSAY